ncbi:DUF3576 domain-containing protein [Rickettsiales endosymbiont of Paramecium tredecaurelia]|nr:DUF3576 domain-containing protein [Candidatus Sarmatiella mevalonica]
MCKYKFFYVLVSCILSISVAYSADKDDADGYPQTLRDQRLEELGSVLPGDGMTFKPNIANRGGGKISQSMWQAALNVLNNAPLSSIDTNSGMIVTDWYNNSKNQSMQVHILVKPGMVDTQNIEVKVFERKKERDGSWGQGVANQVIASDMEMKILQQARDIELGGNNK